MEIIIVCGCGHEHERKDDLTFCALCLIDYMGLVCPECSHTTKWKLIARVTKPIAEQTAASKP